MVSGEYEGRAREGVFSLACPAYTPYSPAVGDFHLHTSTDFHLRTSTALQPLGRFEKTTDVYAELQLLANSHGLILCYKDLGASLQCTGLLPMAL